MSLIPETAFALRAAECWHPSLLGTLGYAWLSSGSLRTALERMQRFIHIVAESAQLLCVDTTEGLQVEYETGRGNTPLGHTIADFGLSLVVAMCRANLGDTLNLKSVCLKRPTPGDIAPYEQFFACKLTFGATKDCFVIPWAVADLRLPTASRELASIFDDILVGELARTPGADLGSRCRSFILQNITSGEPTKDRLAEAMAMSCRTLERKLAEQGMSYRCILDKARHELALRYLDDAGKSAIEITFLLGFSEQSAFTRAFKRWHGLSPTQYRDLTRGAGRPIEGAN
jgi:AraC-like DNA-binding protein